MSLDLRVVSYLLGLLMLVLSSLILALAGFAYADHLAGTTADSADLRALLVAAAAGAFLGFALLAFGKKPGSYLGQREALLLVALRPLAPVAMRLFDMAALRLGETPEHELVPIRVDCRPRG